ncbi:MAG: hypothetical protein M3203_10640 [Actinomycetota bacterium]|nr:hypothetical protein [Actinomycetota bacterium]
MDTLLFVVGFYAVVFVVLVVGITVGAPSWLIGVVTFFALLTLAGTALVRTFRRSRGAP